MLSIILLEFDGTFFYFDEDRCYAYCASAMRHITGLQDRRRGVYLLELVDAFDSGGPLLFLASGSPTLNSHAVWVNKAGYPQAISVPFVIRGYRDVKLTRIGSL